MSAYAKSRYSEAVRMMRSTLRAIRPVLERCPKLATAYRLARATWALTDRPKMTPFGFKLAGNQAMQRGEFEVDETALVRTLLPRVDVLVNAGANIGYYCCIAASMGKRALAFEPVALNVQYLIKNVEANGWKDRVEVYPMALSDKQGVVKIYGGGTGASLLAGWAGASAQYSTLVATTTLDQALGDRFHGMRCLILVDIEGAEKALLDGALALLSQHPKPFWLVEIATVEHQPAGIALNPHLAATFQLFWDLGYEAWTATRPHRRILPAEIERVVSREQYALPTYNFLFVETGQEIWVKAAR